ncbi:transglycosylase-like protein with SLT domain [Rhizobium sp. BK376]|nr:transglycosylase-like protein with SLT domain [Rhizobium sp. BK376]
MVAIGFSSLKRSVAMSAILCGALAGCASTQQQSSQAGLSPAQSNMPHPVTGSAVDGNTALPGVSNTAATGTAVAGAPTNPAQPATLAAQPATLAGQPAVATAQPASSAVLSKSDRLPQATTAVQQTGRLQPQAGQPVQPGQPQVAQDRFGQQPTAQQQMSANQGQAAIAAVTGTPGAQPSASAAYAASDEPVIPSVVAIPIPNPARPGETASMQALAAQNSAEDQSPIPLTPEMVAIQSVIPIPRPDQGNTIPVTEVAYATPAPQLGYVDSRPHYDFNFDTSGPTVVPAVLSESYNDDDAVVSPAEKNFIGRLIQKYAKLYEVPESLIHRVVHRESRYNPSAYNKAGYFGLMQIKYNTAKSMGYQGPPKGLLDAETNIKYAAKYLRGAWMVSDNKPDNAVALYARGYYMDAKNKGMSDIANGDY